jgi:hypothetical protein
MTINKKIESLSEFCDFLFAKISPEEIVDFQLSDEAQERLALLSEKKSAGYLTTIEQEEIDEFLQVNGFLSVLKARAFVRSRQKVS